MRFLAEQLPGNGSMLNGSDPVKFLADAGISPNDQVGTEAILLGRSDNGSPLFRASWQAQWDPAICRRISTKGIRSDRGDSFRSRVSKVQYIYGITQWPFGCLLELAIECSLSM